MHKVCCSICLELAEEINEEIKDPRIGALIGIIPNTYTTAFGNNTEKRSMIAYRAPDAPNTTVKIEPE